MHLLLGDPGEPCCEAVRRALEDRGRTTLVVENPLAEPARFEWRLTTERSRSRLVLDGVELREDRIAGVLALGAVPVDPSGWREADLAYVQAETHAALLAWLWSLPCPVVNRYPAEVWYRPRAPLVAWHGLLRRAGLPVLDTVVTNVEEDARRLGGDGAVFGALTSETRYLVAGERDWSGLAALQRLSPVCLTAPHGEARRACVVGGRVVWDAEPPREARALEPALRRLARAAGLALVEVALAPAARGPAVVAVETRPRVEGYEDGPREEIVDAIVELLGA